MPTTRNTLAILGLIALFVLSGCNVSQPLRSANDSDLFPTSNPDGVDLTRAEQSWLQASDLQDTASTTKIDSPADNDLWTRIRQGFELKSVSNPRIKRQLKWYHDHPNHLPEIEKRARPYLFYIVEALDRRGLPMELALLPAIESAFIPTAYSSQKAAGIWQFMPATGKMLGLDQNWWYDERLDVIAATEAALDYLESLAAQFRGDWELALAAYNAGDGRVRRAIRKNRGLGKATDYWSLDLPRGTKSYVPKLLAMAMVVKNPEAFGTRLTRIPNQPYFGNVDIRANFDLTLAAEIAGLTLDELYQLNPGFKRAANAPQDSHRLVLPVENIEQFNEKLAGLDQNEWRRTRYIIQPGDSLGTIAQRHGTSVVALKQVNRLKSNAIRAGKQLLIPGSAQIVSRSVSTVRGKSRPIEVADSKTIYTVRSGDTLWTIAQSHNVDHKSLAQWNRITLEDTLRPGQKLIILNENIVAEAAATMPVEAVSSLSYFAAAKLVAR